MEMEEPNPTSVADGDGFDSIPKSEMIAQPSGRLSRSDQVFLFVVALFCFIVLTVKNYQHWGTRHQTIEIQRLEKEQFRFQIEINSATWVEWMQLEGIGETTARKIIKEREINGPFLSTADVTRVKGIGAVTLRKIEPHLRCDNCN